jgi:PAS domain-containing protein
MIFWCKASVATWHEDGRPKLVVEISRDITIRKRTEKALRASMEKYRSIIEGIEELL